MFRINEFIEEEISSKQRFFLYVENRRQKSGIFSTMGSEKQIQIPSSNSIMEISLFENCLKITEKKTIDCYSAIFFEQSEKNEKTNIKERKKGQKSACRTATYWIAWQITTGT